MDLDYNDYKNDRENTENEQPKKKKRGSIFFRSYASDGPGVRENDVIRIDEYNVKNLFKLYFRRFRKLVNVNWLYIFGNFPILFLLLAISGNFSHIAPAPTSQYFPVVYGAMTASGSTPSIAALLGIHGVGGTVTAYTTVDYILFGISALFVITFGLVNCGCTNILKNVVKGEQLFIWDDFIGAIKQNWKQGIALGIFDLVVLALCGYSIVSYWANYTAYYVLFYCSIAMTAFYLFMRYYMYTMLVTFDISFFKIIKNSFIFAVLSLGKNLLALIGAIAFTGVMLALFMLFMPLGIIIFLMFYVSTVSYITMYASYPKIKALMIDPYYAADGTPLDGGDGK